MQEQCYIYIRLIVICNFFTSSLYNMLNVKVTQLDNYILPNYSIQGNLD